MKICTTCPDYPTCKSLCPEAEAYVSQDEVKRSPNEVLFTELEIDDIAENCDYPEPEILFSPADWIYLVKKYHPTPTQKKFLYHHYWLGMSFQAIATKYNVSRNAVRQAILRFKS